MEQQANPIRVARWWKTFFNVSHVVLESLSSVGWATSRQGIGCWDLHLDERRRVRGLAASEHREIRSDLCKMKSPHWGLNPGPSVYKTDALPLSYRGSCEDLIAS